VKAGQIAAILRQIERIFQKIAAFFCKIEPIFQKIAVIFQKIGPFFWKNGTIFQKIAAFFQKIEPIFWKIGTSVPKGGAALREGGGRCGGRQPPAEGEAENRSGLCPRRFGARGKLQRAAEAAKFPADFPPPFLFPLAPFRGYDTRRERWNG
jgi:hypothetical protein